MRPSVIVHCDLDCFYAQVERVRLGLKEDACVAVVQWNSALAVSYSARAYGIKRGSTADEIRNVAGDKVLIVPVETIGGSAPREDEDSAVRSDASGADTKNTEKVSLARYRKASAEVFAAMSANMPSDVVFERASIDEAYFDVTAEVERRMRRARTDDVAGAPDLSGTVVVGDKLDLGSDLDRRLAVGAAIAAEIRARVWSQCSYTVSAGICFNKMLAKFASAKNKPNKQTLVPLRSIAELMEEVPLRKLRGLGGKLGSAVEALGVSTAGEATTKLTKPQLLQALRNPKDVEFVFNSVRGIDDSEVQARSKPKSLLAAKNFGSSMSLDPVEHKWVPLLAQELADRLCFDCEQYRREAKTLSITFRVKSADAPAGSYGHMTNATRSTAMPRPGAGTSETGDTNPRAAPIVAATMTILRTAMGNESFSYPITFIGITASNFVEHAAPAASISRYLQAPSITCSPGSLTKALSSKALGMPVVKPSSSASAQSGDTGSVVRNKQQQLESFCDSLPQSNAPRDSETSHARRLQEKADRELALRLHREMQSGGVKRKRATAGPVGKSTGKAAKKSSGAARTSTMDAFMVTKPKKPNT